MINPATMTAKQFQRALRNADDDAEMQLKQYFTRVMRFAVDEGRILDPERMARLYPIFKEVCDEIEEIEAYWSNVENDVRHPMRKVA